MCTLCDQIQERLGIELEHSAASFESIKLYRSNKESAIASIGCGRSEGKSLSITTVNGRIIPEKYRHVGILQGFRREGRLLRWVASSIDPEFHTAICAESDRTWPEATCFFYMWSGVEALVLNEALAFTMLRSPSHLSLHFDGFMLDRKTYQSNVDFLEECTVAVRDGTSYNVKWVNKKKHYALSALRNMADEAYKRPVPATFSNDGNCILNCIGYACNREADAQALIASNQFVGVRWKSYRECAIAMGVGLVPTMKIDLHDGNRILHSENEGSPHCVCIAIAGEKLTMVDGEDVFSMPLGKASGLIDSAVDASTLVMFDVGGANNPALTQLSDAPTTELLLDLRAGAPGNGSVCAKLSAAQKKVIKRIMSTHPIRSGISSFNPKKGKANTSNRVKVAVAKIAKKPAGQQVAYVRHGVPTTKNRADRAPVSRTMCDIYIWSPPPPGIPPRGSESPESPESPKSPENP